MRWGTPKEYAWLHKVSGSTYQNALLFWLQTENPSLYQLTMKEIGRVSPKGSSPSQGKANRRSGPGDTRSLPELEGTALMEGLQASSLDIPGEPVDDPGHCDGED